MTTVLKSNNLSSISENIKITEESLSKSFAALAPVAQAFVMMGKAIWMLTLKLSMMAREALETRVLEWL